jgi:NAD(P)-dependent dehydrogenase (short-subunit alcohol dehydrogenase family)
MVRRLTGKVAIVTGAGRGIGYAIAEKMVSEGASVVIAEINGGDQAAQSLREKGLNVSAVQTDITNEESVQQSVARTVDTYGTLNILVNNAGMNFYYDATQMSSDEWDRAMAVDLKGAWLCCKYAIPAMREQGGGAIVNIASVHASMTTYGMFPYAAAKSALIGMTRSLALDWAAEKIRVVAVSPGWVRTHLVEEWLQTQVDPQTAEDRVLETIPLHQIAVPHEIANLVAFVASDEASYLTGTEIVIDGGVTARFAT